MSYSFNENILLFYNTFSSNLFRLKSDCKRAITDHINHFRQDNVANMTLQIHLLLFIVMPKLKSSFILA